MSMESFVYEMSLRLSREGYLVSWHLRGDGGSINLSIFYNDHDLVRPYRRIEIETKGQFDFFIPDEMRMINKYFEHIKEPRKEENE